MERRPLSRQAFLKLGGAGLALSAGLPFVAACAGDSGSESGGLTATYMKSGTYDVAANDFAKEFEKKNDTNISIEAFPYAALRQNNTNAVMAGTCDYNVVSGSYYLADIYDSFRPLDDLVERNDFSKPLAAGLWEQCSINNGAHIGVPYGPDAYALMYRSDLWEEAGLSWPKSWDEFLAALKNVRAEYGDQGITPLVFAAGAPEQLPALFFATYDGYFINDQGKYGLDSAKATEAIKFAEQLLSFAPQDVTAISIDEANSKFVDGEAAVLYGWPSFLVKTASDPDSSQIVGKWRVGEMPQPGFVWLSMWEMYTTDCTENVNAAWKWMTFWSKPENDRALLPKYGVNPVLGSTYRDQQLLKEYSHYFPGEEKNVARAMFPPLSGEPQDFLASTLGDVFTGKSTAEEAVRSVNEKWTEFDVQEPLSQAAQRNGLVQS